MLDNPNLGPLDRPIAVTFFVDKWALKKREESHSLRALANRILNRSRPSKNELPWLKLAVFGNRPDPVTKCLRHDGNILGVTGVELDYDQGQIPMEEAAELLEKANLAALLYTSPSHRKEFPKWRILAPFSETLDRSDRAQMAGRIAGLFFARYGVNPFDGASWASSQSFFYGYVINDEPFHHKTRLVEGEEVDLQDKLDETSVGKPNTAPRHKDAATSGEAAPYERIDLDLCEQAILSGGNYHHSLLSIAGHYVARGADEDEIVAEMDRLMQAVPPEIQRRTYRRWRPRSTLKHHRSCIAYCLKNEPKHLFRDYERSEEEGDKPIADEPESGGAQGEGEDEEVGEAEAGHADDVAAFVAADIPERPWLIPRLALRGALTAVFAPGGSGKSTFATHVAIAAATGEAWSGWTPRKALRTLYINLEDDRHEKARRFIACARAMRATIPAGMIASSRAEAMTIARISLSGSVIRTPKLAELKAQVEAGGYDMIVVDPFIETHEASENDNTAIKTVTALWRELARATNTAILLVHHARKGSSEDGGEADMARGATSFLNLCRIGVYMAAMKPHEADKLGLPPEDARLYVSVNDSAKQNYAPPANRIPWFKHAGVLIGNGRLTSEGDNVGVLEPWDKPTLFAGLDTSTLNQILDIIDAGFGDKNPTDQLWSVSPKMQKERRWAGSLLTAKGKSTSQAQEILDMWIESRLLTEEGYRHDGKPKTGVKVDNAKRPGAQT